MAGFTRTTTAVIPVLAFLILVSMVSPSHSLSEAKARSYVPPPTPFIAIKQSRLDLFSNALRSMYFKRDGQFINDKSYEELFMPEIKKRYAASKMYRTFVIAFELGVMPKMTQTHGSSCKPADYSNKYKDASNKSVTWHYQKKFTFESYAERNNMELQYCNYMLGLVCSRGSCKCPINAQYVSGPDHFLQCFIKNDEVCALIDLAHGNDPTHSALAKNMPHMIFNLERPLSCKKGYQCRFKKDDLNFPRCYKNEDGPFHPPPQSLPTDPLATWKLRIGAECAIGLYADPGSCDVNTGQYGALPGLVCYDFGPPWSYIRLNKINTYTDILHGFCAPEQGSWGIVSVASALNGQMEFDPLFMGYATPRNIPYRGQELQNFYLRFLKRVHYKVFDLDMQTQEEDGECDTTNSNVWRDFWVAIRKMEYNPKKPPKEEDWPSAEDFYNKTMKEFSDKHKGFLEAVILLFHSPQRKLCRPCQPYYFNRNAHATPKALICEEGKCAITPLKGPNKKVGFGTYTDRFEEFRNLTSVIQLELLAEDYNYDETILKMNMEENCTWHPTTRSFARDAPLENRHCDDGYICHEDYGDYRDIYFNNATTMCVLKKNAHSEFICHPSNTVQYGHCESRHLDNLIKQENISKVVQEASTLGLGENCPYDLEKDLRSWIDNPDSENNKYKILDFLKNQKQSGEKQFCAATRLLKCSRGGICTCPWKSEPREVNVDGQMIQSDYCYFVSGYCGKMNVSKFITLTQSEMKEVSKHYGKPKTSRCSEANFCVMLLDDERDEQCTNSNGYYDVINKYGWGYAGASPKADGTKLMEGITLVILVAGVWI